MRNLQIALHKEKAGNQTQACSQLWQLLGLSRNACSRVCHVKEKIKGLVE